LCQLHEGIPEAIAVDANVANFHNYLTSVFDACDELIETF
jgi:hypothetical protein